MLMTGIVVKAAGSLYTVLDKASGERHDCKIRGKLRLKDTTTTNPITVGDVVQFEAGAAPVVVGVQPRRNYIIRRSTNLSKEAHIVAANIDQAFLLVTVDYPPVSAEFIDRFLVSAEAYRIPTTIVIGKMDLYRDEAHLRAVKTLDDVYSKVGYKVVKVSSQKEDDVRLIKDLLANKTTLFSGNSGVGKSTLLNALNANLSLRVGEISSYHNRGKHTTTFSEMVEVEPNTFVIDTPGIKGFGLLDVGNAELYHFFREIFAASHECKFANCEHIREPHCAVRKAVRQGRISEQRYASYLKMREEDGKYRR